MHPRYEPSFSESVFIVCLELTFGCIIDSLFDKRRNHSPSEDSDDDQQGLFEDPFITTQFRADEGRIAIRKRSFRDGKEELTNITIPSSVESIGEEAFWEASSLLGISLPSSIITIRCYAFYRCTSLLVIHLPQCIDTIERWAFYGCTSLVSIDLPPCITSIEGNAFNRCTSLANINLPPSITAIENNTFCGCISLVHIDIPPSITYIGYGAFEGCTSLVDISLPPSIIAIERRAFKGCTSLVSFDLPPRIITIEGCAFQQCPSLISITIPVQTQIYSDSFDEHHTDVIHSNWFGLSPYIKMRKLIDNGRAIPLDEVDGRDLHTLQFFIVNICDDLFRKVLEMTKEEPPPPPIESFAESD